MALHQKLIDNRWRAAGTVAAVAVTTVGGGVAWAASGDTSPSPSTSPSTAPSNSTENRPDPGRGPRGGPFGDALHGEFVTAKDGGGYQTIATQKGEVSEVSATSITVKSADGYSRTYTVNGDTKVNGSGKIADIKTGETVRVRAVVADGTATATSVGDGTGRPAGGPDGTWPGGSQGAKPGDKPSATPTK
jgi:hypothetical protein